MWLSGDPRGPVCLRLPQLWSSLFDRGTGEDGPVALLLFIKIILVRKTLRKPTLAASSGGAILHVLTGVKRLAGDNTAVSGTPSLDNYITPGLHCSHSLLIILLNSQWLESRWQRDKWQRVGGQWSPTLPTAPPSVQSFCQVTMELCRHTVDGCSFKSTYGCCQVCFWDQIKWKSVVFFPLHKKT